MFQITTLGKEQRASEVSFAKELEVKREAYQAGRYYIKVVLNVFL
jgi:hypothetical protein